MLRSFKFQSHIFLVHFLSLHNLQRTNLCQQAFFTVISCTSIIWHSRHIQNNKTHRKTWKISISKKYSHSHAMSIVNMWDIPWDYHRCNWVHILHKLLISRCIKSFIFVCFAGQIKQSERITSSLNYFHCTCREIVLLFFRSYCKISSFCDFSLLLLLYQVWHSNKLSHCWWINFNHFPSVFFKWNLPFKMSESKTHMLLQLIIAVHCLWNFFLLTSKTLFSSLFASLGSVDFGEIYLFAFF